LIRKKSADQEIVDKLETFNFFKKEQYLRDFSQVIFLSLIGLVMMFLMKNPFIGFRPILIAGGSFFFRYSFFGNVIFVISLLRLYKLSDSPLLRKRLLLTLFWN